MSRSTFEVIKFEDNDIFVLIVQKNYNLSEREAEKRAVELIGSG